VRICDHGLAAETLRALLLRSACGRLPRRSPEHSPANVGPWQQGRKSGLKFSRMAPTTTHSSRSRATATGEHHSDGTDLFLRPRGHVSLERVALDCSVFTEATTVRSRGGLDRRRVPGDCGNGHRGNLPELTSMTRVGFPMPSPAQGSELPQVSFFVNREFATAHGYGSLASSDPRGVLSCTVALRQ
jgi:hypothetical protein